MKIIEFVKEIYGEFNRKDGLGLSSEISYHSLFSLFPFLLLLVSVIGFMARFSWIQAQFLVIIYNFAPPMALDFINSAVLGIMESNSVGVFSLGLVVTLWAGSAVLDSLIKALDRIYGVEESRSFIRRKAFSMLLLVVAIFLFLLSTFLVLLGDIILELVGGNLIFMRTLQFLGVLLLVMLNILLLNRFLPNTKIPVQRLLPGAAFFSFVWVLATYIFRFYVMNFGRYNVIYGSIGGIIVLMTWIYITTVLILLGATINSVIIRLKKNHKSF